LKRLQLFMHTK